MPTDDTLARGLQAWLQQRTGQPVALVETHISWVLLTARLALKLKKPVRLPFLDFSTPALREHFCREELRLNRRLAPTLYRAVLPVRGGARAPRLGGAGPAIDHVVCMRRFPDDALLSHRLQAGRLPASALEALARRLARFHRDAPAAGPGSSFGSPEQVMQPVLAVLRELTEEGADMTGWAAWAQAQHGALEAAWRQRRERGGVRECHGDLHLANAVVLGNEVTAFDGIEFDPALRWIDTMSDVAFLTMDLRAHGQAPLAWRFLDAYLESSGDFEGLRVLRFYEVYRALVRALVARLAAQGSDQAGTQPDYLGCAEALRGEAQGGRARLAVLFGLSGSGKSTLALQLVQAAGAVRVRSDVERKRLFGLGALDTSAAAGADIYTPEANRRTYLRLADCAREALEGGYPVIVDAAFLRRDERLAFEALAREMGVPFTLFACSADPALLRRRVAGRSAAGADASEADVQVLERQLRDHEPPQGGELAHTIAVDTGSPVDAAALSAAWRHACAIANP